MLNKVSDRIGYEGMNILPSTQRWRISVDEISSAGMFSTTMCPAGLSCRTLGEGAMRACIPAAEPGRLLPVYCPMVVRALHNDNVRQAEQFSPLMPGVQLRESITAEQKTQRLL
jgi:hypothetical protein